MKIAKILLSQNLWTPRSVACRGPSVWRTFSFLNKLGRGRDCTGLHPVMSRMDKKEDKEKEKDTTLSYLKNVYMENIPMEALQDPGLPKKYRYQLGFIAYAVMGFLFLYSLVTNFQTALKEKYMSFESDSGNCKTVERPLTGTFKMDYYGNWEGSSLYQPNQAIYEAEFNRLLVDEASFRNQMLEIDKYIIQPFVEYANWLPLYYILLYHMGHERYVNVNGNKQVFRFNGYPKRIYQAENFFGGVASSSVQGCNFAGESSLYLGSGFEYESGKLYVQYDYQLYLNSSKCMGALDTSQIITNPFSSPRELKFEVSVESLIIADAVNKMLIPFENMIQATSERYDFPYYDGYNYTYTSWYYLFDNNTYTHIIIQQLTLTLTYYVGIIHDTQIWNLFGVCWVYGKKTC